MPIQCRDGYYRQPTEQRWCWEASIVSKEWYLHRHDRVLPQTPLRSRPWCSRCHNCRYPSRAEAMHWGSWRSGRCSIPALRLRNRPGRICRWHRHRTGKHYPGQKSPAMRHRIRETRKNLWRKRRKNSPLARTRRRGTRCTFPCRKHRSGSHIYNWATWSNPRRTKREGAQVPTRWEIR